MPYWKRVLMMIVKFHPRGRGGGGGPVDYLLGKIASATAPAFCRGSRMKSGSLSTPRPTPKSTLPAFCLLPNRIYRPASAKS